MRSAIAVSAAGVVQHRYFAMAWLLALAILLHAPGLRAETTVKLAGTGSATPLLEALGKAFENRNPTLRIQIALPPMGSTAGQRAVMAGAIDLALSSKPLAPADKAKGGRDWPLGRTPFLLVTHEAGRLSNIDNEQLAEIYSGRTITWADGSLIRLVLRPPTETDTKLLRALSPAMDKAMDAALSRPGLPVAANDLDNDDLLEKTPGSFGTSNLALLTGLKSRLNPVPLNGVAPTLANLESGRYPYEKALYVIRGPVISAAGQAFLDFMLSAEGRGIVAGQGYLPATNSR